MVGLCEECQAHFVLKDRVKDSQEMRETLRKWVQNHKSHVVWDGKNIRILNTLEMDSKAIPEVDTWSATHAQCDGSKELLCPHHR